MNLENGFTTIRILEGKDIQIYLFKSCVGKMYKKNSQLIYQKILFLYF